MILLKIWFFTCALLAQREIYFDQGWEFRKAGDWKKVTIPHDWSIEDLTQTSQKIIPRDGIWLFQHGDDSKWSDPSYDDSKWNKVNLPSKWKKYSNDNNPYAWYRKHIQITNPEEVILNLGTVIGADETFVNGQRIGNNGNSFSLNPFNGFPPNYEEYWSNVFQKNRSYTVPSDYFKPGDNVISVRMYSPYYESAGIYDAFETANPVGPFNPQQSLGGNDTGFTVGGEGWYRKSFTVSEADLNKSFYLVFDGIYMNSEVILNGEKLGDHPNGYTGFYYHLTPFLKNQNEIIVHVRNTGQNSRWYTGSGIFRHVRIIQTNPVHVLPWGILVNSQITDQNKATVEVRFKAGNFTKSQRDLVAKVSVLTSDNLIVGEQTLPLNFKPQEQSKDFFSTLEISEPKLWSLEHPHLYTAKIELLDFREVIDQSETSFGIRTIKVDAVNGFQLNGKTIKLHGGCVHHDKGPLGAKALGRAEERQLEILKAHGYNAIRTSHNPPSLEFLEAADRLGILVIVEFFDQWESPKNSSDYHRFFKDQWQKDIQETINRFRNHPSIIAWSIGNEIPERASERGAELSRELSQFTKTLDPTRPVTAAYNGVNESADKYFEPLDIAGYNYNPEKYGPDHQRIPNRVILGTESYPKEIYNYWQEVESKSWVIGDFSWTAFDYIGETGIGHTASKSDFQSYLRPWPWVLSNSGDFDICGFQKPQSLFRDVLWDVSPIEMVVRNPKSSEELVSHWGWPSDEVNWNWPNHLGKPIEVRVFTKAQSVDLYLNNRKMGTQNPTEMVAVFSVPYWPGKLSAVARNSGQVIGSRFLITHEGAKKLSVKSDQDNLIFTPDQLAYVTVEAIDRAGNRDLSFDQEFSISVEGPGTLIGVCNGNPKFPMSYQSSKVKMFKGRALFVIQPTGEPGQITMKVSTQNLKASNYITVH